VGEKILVLGLARIVINYLQIHKGATAQDAADYGIQEMDTLKAPGGCICIDSKANIGYAYNTETMTMHCID